VSLEFAVALVESSGSGFGCVRNTILPSQYLQQTRSPYTDRHHPMHSSNTHLSRRRDDDDFPPLYFPSPIEGRGGFELSLVRLMALQSERPYEGRVYAVSQTVFCAAWQSAVITLQSERPYEGRVYAASQAVFFAAWQSAVHL
jgi:drug/metabolite transporter superfamily protein YnfA